MLQDEVYTVKEASTILKCSPNKVYDMIKKNQLKGLKIGNTKIPKKDLENLLQGGE